MSTQPPDPDSSSFPQVLQQLSDLSQRVTRLEEQLQLVSDIDKYGQLREFLAAGNFKAGDRETTDILLNTAGKHRETLTPEDVRQFPCSVLQVIDRLWRTYSEDRFGFSTQLQIYQRAGGSLDTLRTQDSGPLAAFAGEVGWLENGKVRFDVYDRWDFSLSAPTGCFPALWWKSPYGLKMVTYFFTRLFDCQLDR